LTVIRLTPNCTTSSASEGISPPGRQRPSARPAFRCCLTREYGAAVARRRCPCRDPTCTDLSRQVKWQHLPPPIAETADDRPFLTADRPPAPGARPARRRHHLPQLADRGRLPDAPEQPRPEVAENPDALVVYGGIGKAARNWDCFEAILKALRELAEDESLLVQSGKPVAVLRTHPDAPRVLIANSNLVPKWATWEHFDELDRKGLMMYGQMTAGSWIYIGSQGIVQGTYETFAEAGRQHYGGDMSGR